MELNEIIKIHELGIELHPKLKLNEYPYRRRNFTVLFEYGFTNRDFEFEYVDDLLCISECLDGESDLIMVLDPNKKYVLDEDDYENLWKSNHFCFNRNNTTDVENFDLVKYSSLEEDEMFQERLKFSTEELKKIDLYYGLYKSDVNFINYYMNSYLHEKEYITTVRELIHIMEYVNGHC